MKDAGDLGGKEQVGRVDEDADDEEDTAVEQAHLVGVQDVQSCHQAVLGIQPFDVGKEVLNLLHLSWLGLALVTDWSTLVWSSRV